MQTLDILLSNILHNRPICCAAEKEFFTKLKKSAYFYKLEGIFETKAAIAIITFDAYMLYILASNTNHNNLINNIRYYKKYDNVKKSFMHILSLPWDDMIKRKLVYLYSQIKI